MASKKFNPAQQMDVTLSKLGESTKKQKEEKTIENKTKRVTLAFRESAWNDFCTLAHMKEESPNEMLSTFVEWSVKANKELIEKHRKAKDTIKDVMP